MSALLFGTAGVPISSQERASTAGIERIKDLGLGAMELEFVRGVHMSETAARLVAETAARTGIKLSAHAPYFINLNSHDPQKIIASRDRILKTARIASVCGAQSVIFHPAFYLGDPPKKTYDNVKQHLAEVLKTLREENISLKLRPEVTGKPSQFGTIDEIISLCTELEGLAPCIDFSHWHARTGQQNTYLEFSATLIRVKERLGQGAIENLHLHVSGIRYGAKGELSHLNLKDSDLNYPELLRALKDHGAGGLVICESPNLEDDAQLLKATYGSLK